MVATALTAAATIGGTLLANNQADKAARAQSQAADRAAEVQRQNFLDFVELNKPAIEAGNTSRNKLLDAIGLNGEEQQQIFFDNFKTDPGFQAGIDRGIGAIQGTAAARGNLNSGRTLKELSNFTTDSFLNNAFNKRLNRLSGLAGAGQQAINTQGQIGFNTASNVGNNLVRAGQAQAGGATNTGNLITGATNNLNTLIGDKSKSINTFFGVN